MLDENNQMMGSIMIVDSLNRKELDKFLKTEPYITRNVCKRIEIVPCKIGLSFAK